jgi:hypothetical protein
MKRRRMNSKRLMLSRTKRVLSRFLHILLYTTAIYTLLLDYYIEMEIHVDMFID